MVFTHRGDEWSARVAANHAVAYRIHHNPATGRWYVDASWQRKTTPTARLSALRTGELIGVDMNADHLAAWRLDCHGNPIAAPHTFNYRLDGTADHRDAQLRHALTRLLAMATEAGIAVIAVDPAYTNKWGAQHWQKPLAATHPQTTRHHAASVAIGRRALGHRIRRQTAPPRPHQSDVAGHRIGQARPATRRREETRHPEDGPRTRSAAAPGTMNAGNQATQHRSGPPTEQNSLSLSA